MTMDLQSQANRSLLWLKNERNALKTQVERLATVINKNRENKLRCEDLERQLAHIKAKNGGVEYDNAELLRILAHEITRLKDDISGDDGVSNAQASKLKVLKHEKDDLGSRKHKLERELENLQLTMKQRASEKDEEACRRQTLERELDLFDANDRFDDRYYAALEKSLVVGPRKEDAVHVEGANTTFESDMGDGGRSFKQEVDALIQKQHDLQKSHLELKLKTLTTQLTMKQARLHDLRADLDGDMKRLSEIRNQRRAAEREHLRAKEKFLDMKDGHRQQVMAVEVKCKKLHDRNVALENKIQRRRKQADDAWKIVIQLQQEINVYSRLMGKKPAVSLEGVNETLDDSFSTIQSRPWSPESTITSFSHDPSVDASMTYETLEVPIKDLVGQRKK